MSAPSPIWLELHLDRTGTDIQISARGSRGEQLAARTWRVGPDALARFGSTLQKAGEQGRPLDAAAMTEAQSFYQSLLEGEVGVLFAKLQEAAQGPLLVRLFMHDADLQRTPWEALCNPEESLGFWGSSAKVLPVRGVMSSAPWQPREVRGAVRVLAIAPTGSAGLDNLKQALAERIASGEVEWLDPVEGAQAKVTALFDRLRREPIPHVLHFLGHGRVTNGIPELRVADQDDEEKWLDVSLLAQELQANFKGLLRLVILEACEGAAPGAMGSAAEILARQGADSVVAHLWPVRADVARTCSTEFYRAIAGSNANAGNVAIALNEARRVILGAYDASAQALSPVVYLRGPNGQIFRLNGRKIAIPQAMPGASTGSAGDVPSGLQRIMRNPFTLVLGDRWTDDQTVLEAFRDKLQKELTKLSAPPPPGLPLSTLAEWFGLRKGLEKLGSEFQKVFRVTTDAPELLVALAKILPPGVHVTMLRNPWLEQALADARQDCTIYVIQPSDDGVIVLVRAAGSTEWEERDDPPADVDLENEFVVLRPCRGYTTEQVFTRPLLTDDDYALRLRDLWSTSVLPVDLANAILRMLGRRPGLLVGLSLLASDHRLLLHHVYARGVPRDTLAIVDLSQQETKLWSSGAGLPGRDEGVEVVETTPDALLSALDAVTQAGRA